MQYCNDLFLWFALDTIYTMITVKDVSFVYILELRLVKHVLQYRNSTFILNLTVISRIYLFFRYYLVLMYILTYDNGS